MRQKKKYVKELEESSKKTIISKKTGRNNTLKVGTQHVSNVSYTYNTCVGGFEAME